MSDMILLWNAAALDANRTSHTLEQGEQMGPPLSARALAITHLAMYDAFVHASGAATTLQPYGPLPAAAGVTSGQTLDPSAAISAAAHRALICLYPSQRARFDDLRGSLNLPDSASTQLGEAVADALYAQRARDPRSDAGAYAPGTGRGCHRPDPDHPDQGFHAAEYGHAALFAAGQRFELARPPSPSHREADYVQALRQVRAKGIRPDLTATLPAGTAPRTPDETLMGVYWAYDGAHRLGTPPRLYNQIVRQIAVQRQNTLEENARLFALVNVALADAGILAWREKYRHDLWRPVLGVREHDPSMGPDAQGGNTLDPLCDPDWLPLGAPATNRTAKNFTPNFPAYPSGHATFGAAALHMVRLFYGAGGRWQDGSAGPDDLFNDMTFVSEECNGVNRDHTGAVRARHARSFPDGLWGMIRENGLSRVFLGVHWVYDAFMLNSEGQPDLQQMEDERPFGGVPLGMRIAEDIFTRSGAAPWRSPVQAEPIPVSPSGAATYTSQLHRSS